MALHTVLTDLQPTLGSNLTLTRIPDALTNACYRITSGKGDFALRLNNPKPDRFGIDRTRERLILSRLQNTAFVIPVIQQQADWLLTPWLESAGHMPVLTRLRNLFEDVHTVPLPTPAEPNWQPLFVDDQIKRLLEHVQHPLSVRQRSAIEQLTARYHRPTEFSLCFHDWHAGNCISTDNGLVLLDWEYAAPGDIAVDVACFSEGFKLSDNQRTELQNRYNITKERFKLALTLTRIMSTLWYGVRFEDVDLDSKLQTILAS